MKVYPKDTIVFAKSGMSATLGRIYKLKAECFIVSHLATIIPNVNWVYPTYLKYFFQAFSPSRLINDPAYPSIRASDIQLLEIPLPPLDIQMQISAVLEKADTLRNQCQQMEQELNALAQSVFLDMFGDPVTNTKGWLTKSFKEIGSAQLGKMLSEKSKQGKNPKKYLRNANIRWRKIELHDLLEMDFNDKEMKKFKLEYGDILLCEGGEVGRCAIWRGELTDCYYQKALHRIRLNSSIATPEYVQEYFFWMAKLGGLSASVSEVTFSHLTAAKLSELIIPLPPIELQHAFVSKISVINDQLNLIESQYVKCFENFESLMQRAFKGELKLEGAA